MCGHCFVVCPQNAKEIELEINKVKAMLSSGEEVYVSLAPSFAANYGVGINSMKSALCGLGFAGAEETAVGAAAVKNEYERILREEKPDALISSCCHTVNLLIEKYYPGAVKYLANVVSPMQAHAEMIKTKHPGARVVFVGPCVSKKDEAALSDGGIDAVLTFDELTGFMEEAGVSLHKCTEDGNEGLTRIFPTVGGILKSMTHREDDYTYITVDGIDDCMAALSELEAGRVHKCFVEMSACKGSCTAGPVMEKHHRSPLEDYAVIERYAAKNDFSEAAEKTAAHKSFSPIVSENKTPTEEELLSILKRMGKFKPSDELNCGSCGYNTCRDKAVAIYRGRAEISMCLPYLKEKAESFSDNVVKNTPNALLVLNEELEVQQINSAAMRLMGLTTSRDVLGERVVKILDPKIFMDVLETKRNIKNQKVYLAEYERFAEQTVIYDRDYRLLICIMRDITEEEEAREKKEEINKKTVEIADKVVGKQMRIVQEIASLLGETAAETKVALTKLKETIADE